MELVLVTNALMHAGRLGVHLAYVVADITHGKEIPDPNQPGRKTLVFQVFLAKEEEWPLIEMPAHVRQMLNEGEK